MKEATEKELVEAEVIAQRLWEIHEKEFTKIHPDAGKVDFSALTKGTRASMLAQGLFVVRMIDNAKDETIIHIGETVKGRLDAIARDHNALVRILVDPEAPAITQRTQSGGES